MTLKKISHKVIKISTAVGATDSAFKIPFSLKWLYRRGRNPG